LYHLAIYSLGFLLKILSHFNPKIKKGVLGRAETFIKLRNHINSADKTLWFHCASLGEYEQGLPVFKVLRKDYPNHKVVLSFFSPSGYEVRQNSNLADLVVYLPLDTKTNAKVFVDLVHPELVVFVKYDIWPNFLSEIKARNVRAILISALFRKNQAYFKFYGKRLKNALYAFEHIFVQDEKSMLLLHTINYKAVTVSGDTRYDRVHAQLEQDNRLAFVSDFKNDSLCIVVGSSWPEDEDILLDFINNNKSNNVKFIIAPHEITRGNIERLLSRLGSETVLFTKRTSDTLKNHSVFIIDTVGYLSRIYAYADISYVGGAMGNTGLHNILEPAVFGVPVVIGKNFDKFPEAKAMIENAGVTSVKNARELKTVMDTYLKNEEFRLKEGKLNRAFIERNKGAVVQIMSFLRK